MKLTTATMLNYALAILGGLVVGRWGITPDNWKEISDALITLVPAVLALIGAVRGISAAAQPKVSSEGEAVALPPETAKTIAQAAKERPRTLIDAISSLNLGR
jgi:uncharacterized protein YjeT (DUF2065 family)